MNDFVYKITLDLNCSKTPPVICSGQFDKGRKFEFTITANGEPYDVTGCSAVLKGVRTDGSHFAVECTASAGKIIKTLDDTTLSVRGKTVAKLVISDSSKSYSTQMFIIDVDSSLDGDITVADDYSILNRLIEQIHALNESGAIIIDDTIDKNSNNAVANKPVAISLASKEIIDNKISDRSKITDEYANYPSIKYLDEYYYDFSDVDGLLENKADKATTDEIIKDLDKLNSGGLIIKDDVIKDDINNWLNEHPEATTTVQDGAITDSKIEANLLSKISRNGFLSVIDFKAKGNGISDDTNAFTDCINCAKAENKNIFIPAGTYVITDDLPTIPAGIVIAGEDVGQAAYIDKLSITTIIDARNSTEYLFRQDTGDLSRNGGEIRNIYFLNAKLSNGSYVANEDGNGYCLDIYRGGWDGLISNCTFDSYRTALRKGGNDYRVNNCKFYKCGTLVNSESIDYAVELVDNCNETLLNSCHFEHCRFFVRVANAVRNTSNSSYNNVFNSCKFEQSMKGITINSTLPQIYVASKNSYPAALFIACRFIQMDIDAYPHDNAYSNIPYFMDITNCKVNASQFVCGYGSSTVAYTKNNNALYLNAKKSKISDCTFLKAAKQKSPIKLVGSQFTNNHIKCDFIASDNDTTAKTLVEYDVANAVVKDNVYEGNATNQMAMQRFMSRYDFIGEKVSSMPALSPFGQNGYYFGDNKTIAIRKAFDNATADFCVTFGITLRCSNTNSTPVGRFVIKIIFTQSVKTASIITKAEMSMNGKELPVNVYFMNDELLYIQIPEYKSLLPYSIIMDGLEGQKISAYIAPIGDTITDSVASVSLSLT